MTEVQMYEMLGRKQEKLELLDVEYSNLLSILSKVAAGEIALDAIHVDLEKRSWAIDVPPQAIIGESETVQ